MNTINPQGKRKHMQQNEKHKLTKTEKHMSTITLQHALHFVNTKHWIGA